MTKARNVAALVVLSAIGIDLGFSRCAQAKAGPTEPLWIYDNWSAYDELSDTIRLTESLSLRELEEIKRLKSRGVRIDYYLMDAFWFSEDGGYRTWRAADWPKGPDAWIAACRAAGIKPGLWFGTNGLFKIRPVPKWRDSMNAKGAAMSLSNGGFLSDFMDALQSWYDRGVRMFKFDFADMMIATPVQEKTLSGAQILERNQDAFRAALADFRRKNPEAVLLAYNGFGGDIETTSGPFPFRNPIDPRWLDVFDSMYSGDPRPSDVPTMNFWRSLDIYSDHMVRRFEQSGLPPSRIDSAGFMIGTTGTVLSRGKGAWKGMLLLLAARGGWIQILHGNLELLDEADAAWIARVQRLFDPLKKTGKATAFGGIPGQSEPYGFAASGSEGALYAVVNPAQRVQRLALPKLEGAGARKRVLFQDLGFEAAFDGDAIALGPEQLALIGTGRFADEAYDLGRQTDVRIPRAIDRVEFRVTASTATSVTGVVDVPAKGDLRIILRQLSSAGAPQRSWKGAPPDGVSMERFFRIEPSQRGKALPVELQYDKKIWSGLSWGVAEVRRGRLDASEPVTIRCSTQETDLVSVNCSAFRVEY